MNRKKEREIIILTLYSIEISGNDIYDTVNYVLEQSKVEKASEYIYDTINGIQNNLEQINSVISRNLENYNLDRLSYIDQSIIRYATYELLYNKEIHYAVVINEALELTKKYSDVGDNKATAFNNSVLDKIRVDLKLE